MAVAADVNLESPGTRPGLNRGSDYFRILIACFNNDVGQTKTMIRLRLAIFGSYGLIAWTVLALLMASCNGGGGDSQSNFTTVNGLSVLTHHNDNARTGRNLQETVLTPANVNATRFGKLFALPVDGYVYAQPLYVANLNIGGQLHNVVFVATEHNSVYCFDADSPALPLWRKSFINPAAGVTTVPSSDVNCTDLIPEIGITGTPVIDPSTGWLYVVAKTKENGTYVQRIHALEIATGAEAIAPVQIRAAVPGTGNGSDGTNVAFDPLWANQRAALLLSNGVLYIAWAGHCDNGPYHGWVLAYDASNLQLIAAFNTTPNGGLGGIWLGAGGPSVDAAGNVYVITGNGTFDANTGGNNFGDSFLKLTGRTLTLSDYFTPYNQAALEAADMDLGSGTPLILPNQTVGPPHLMVSAGKEGTLYLLNRDAMGQFNSGGDQVVQSLPGALGGGLFGSPAYFQNTIYINAANDVMRAFTLRNGELVLAGQAQNVFGWPGATPSISANGSSNVILWALKTDQYGSGGAAVLYAYSAANLTELYNSGENPARDNPGVAVKFTVPTVANGKVYVGTQNQLAVFGILP